MMASYPASGILPYNTGSFYNEVGRGLFYVSLGLSMIIKKGDLNLKKDGPTRICGRKMAVAIFPIYGTQAIFKWSRSIETKVQIRD
jgi:hypothetical protein